MLRTSGCSPDATVHGRHPAVDRPADRSTCPSSSPARTTCRGARSSTRRRRSPCSFRSRGSASAPLILIPTVVTAAVILSYRPRFWAWSRSSRPRAPPGCAAHPDRRDPTIWLVMLVALATRWPWVSAFIWFKPSVFPFALIGIRDRRWWIVSAAFAISRWSCCRYGPVGHRDPQRPRARTRGCSTRCRRRPWRARPIPDHCVARADPSGPYPLTTAESMRGAARCVATHATDPGEGPCAEGSKKSERQVRRQRQDARHAGSELERRAYGDQQERGCVDARVRSEQQAREDCRDETAGRIAQDQPERDQANQHRNGQRQPRERPQRVIARQREQKVPAADWLPAVVNTRNQCWYWSVLVDRMPNTVTPRAVASVPTSAFLRQTSIQNRTGSDEGLGGEGQRDPERNSIPDAVFVPGDG